jgi:hypothetical protein
MLGGTQAAANSVMFKIAPGTCGGVWGTAAEKLTEVKIDVARMSPNMVNIE